MRSLEDEAGIYGGELVALAYHYKLPRELFAVPDNVVIRAADIHSFGKLFREEVAPRSNQAVCVETEPRIKVAAKLSGRLAVYELGSVEWIEVDEPRIEQATDVVQHMEFYTDSLEKSKTILKNRHIPSHLKSDDYRSYIDVHMPDNALQFRFTNIPLGSITKHRINNDKVIPVGLGKKTDRV